MANAGSGLQCSSGVGAHEGLQVHPGVQAVGTNLEAGSKCYPSCEYVRAASSTAKQRRTVSMGDVGEKCHAFIRLEDSTEG
mmetsp:Transcript_8442/g.21554  ORF Transcript_8442/g.21554 Transcript_8442/m.21554 type:complete len:81 (+) Transcript_8442:110-352(+)